MKLSEFRLLPLIRRFISLDKDTGDLLMHEVRRDPKSGLTLTLGLNPLDRPPANPERTQ
jgi:hypothetical protein